MVLPRPIATRVGPVWAARLEQPGYLLLPLRMFLGITFCYAGLQKLASPAYLDSSNPASVYSQMRALEGHSPISPLVSLAVHAPTLVGLMIAFGELAVGVGTLLGLLSRVAATGGALLALSFFLTVSWNTAPYYYGSDIVFVFAWTVLIGFGSGGVLSMDAWLRGRARRQVGLPPAPAAGPGGSKPERLSPRQSAELDRRTVMTTGVGVAGVAAATAFLAGTTAAVGRANDQTSAPPAAPPAPGGQPAAHGPKKSAPSGSAIVAASSLAVGTGKPFVDPKTRRPAWLVHVAPNQFAAFSAVCTHAGCTVNFDPSSEHFVCPCHGGTYDAKTGRVLGGPPFSPLPSIPVQVRNGEVYPG